MRMPWWESDGVRAFTLSLIRNYMYHTGRQVFTYRDLRIYYYGTYSDHIYDWHSVERAIRRLAQEGVLSRLRSGKHVIFGLTREGVDLAARVEGVTA